MDTTRYVETMYIVESHQNRLTESILLDTTIYIYLIEINEKASISLIIWSHDNLEYQNKSELIFYFH